MFRFTSWIVVSGCAASTAPLPFCEAPAGLVVSTTACNASGTPSFATLGDALEVAADGDTIHLFAGTWPESVIIERAIQLVAHDDAVLAPGEGPGVVIAASGKVVITDLTITGALGVGVAIAGGDVTLRNVAVVGARGDDERSPGHGVQATDGAVVLVDGGRVFDCDGVGILAVGATLTVLGTVVEGSDSGGIAVVSTAFPGEAPLPWPSAIRSGNVNAVAAATITGATVDHSATYGVGLFGASAALSNAIVSATRGGGDGGDGLRLVNGGEGQQVTLDAGCRIEGSDRAGIYASTEPANGPSVTVLDIAAAITGNSRSGIWAQGQGLTVRIAPGAFVDENEWFGVVATEGARLEIGAANVSNTRGVLYAPPEGGDAQLVGDGVLVAQGASLYVVGANITGSARAGLLLDAPSAEISVDALTVMGGQYGLVVQHAPAGANWTAESLAAAVSATGFAVAATATDLGLETPSEPRAMAPNRPQ